MPPRILPRFGAPFGTCLIACALLTFCDPSHAGAAPKKTVTVPQAASPAALSARAIAALDTLPLETRVAAWAAAAAAPQRFEGLLAAAEAARRADPWLLFLVDALRALPRDYEPSDLVSLDGSGLSLSRAGHRLRRPARDALLEMDSAARAAGVLLLVSSAYRSFDYQAGVWERGVAAEGEAAAAAVIARAGHSQHQLGMAIDFGSIDESFAETAASIWLERNAARFGFSLSFPRSGSGETGYSWESWHYRFVGKAVAVLEREFFDGFQHRCLAFLSAY
ncbi:MAG: M15 family metallopeptidase [Spirochaetaceae bacterium]|nr:M15 family metallopeptidase [Spirochaetaceae bacterium]